MLNRLLRNAFALTLIAAAVSCSSNDDAEGYTLRVGATSVTGTPAGSLGWGDKQGILTEQLKSAGIGKIEYSFFQSGSDVASACSQVPSTSPPSATTPDCGHAVETRKWFCCPLIRSTVMPGWWAPRAGPPRSRA
ncbi:nitrate/sulfonate/bicarbonate ABC transporter periplasmic component-like protein [Mycolicibacterium conceptionense]|uniref:Nitrate/sulfonate/bicarbonate ABC transporter periplasmic component-like protein n=1 Tax=Mycolicibacterium conceptionense TaxID=451644 RepID=A0A0U1DJV6_9MYCO|nr:nitrate/sulfonate/bicarbonate ABC transporter periplasmic component-like protein [Mycolicibacterium conceptionense]